VLFLKRQLPIIIAFISGILMWARYYIPTEGSITMQDEFTRWARIIVGFASLLGILSLLHHHWSKIKLKRPGFGYSWVTISAFVVMAGAGLLPIHFPGFAEVQNQSASFHKWMYDYLFVPMQATMFSILAFFIASAAFRAFRARSLEASALLLAACIVMVGRVPVGDYLASHLVAGAGTDKVFHFFDLPTIASWLLNVPNTAAARGILLGVLLSQIAISVRIIFGIERTYMGGGD
jgi:hypothetical protein